MKYGMVTLSVAEAKRLIAQGVAALPQIQRALEHGTIIVAGGTTNAYVAEELTGTEINKGQYTAGVISGGRCCLTPADTRLDSIVLRHGKPVDVKWPEALSEMTYGDIFIKGANAWDLQGNVGILLGSPTGGTIGSALGSLSARGIELVAPVGMEKLVPSLPAAAEFLGVGHLDYSRGMQCGMQIVTGATIISEDKALSLLSGCRVNVTAKGGVGGSTGSTTLTFAGNNQEFEKALAVLDMCLGEKALVVKTQPCPCRKPCEFGRPKSSS